MDELIARQRCAHHGSRRSLDPPLLKYVERGLALQAMPLFTVADAGFERRQKIECYVGGLKIFGIGLRDVVNEGSEGARTRRGHRLVVRRQRRGIDSRE